MVGDYLTSNRKPLKSNRRRNRGKLFYISILIVFLYFISRMPPLLSASAQSTYTIEYGKIEKTIQATGYIAREEKVFTNMGRGDIKYFVTQGERVAKGQKLAEIYLEQLDEKSIRDLEAISLRLQNIKEKQNEQGFFKNDTERLDKEIATLIRSIQEDLKEEEYGRITSKKQEIASLLDKKSIIAGEKSFSGKNLNQLEEQKTYLENKVNSSVQTIYSNSSGFVAMGSDGFEDLLNYKLLHEINSKQLRKLEDGSLNLSRGEDKDGQAVIRIIENYKWSIITEIDKGLSDKINKGQKVQIRTIDPNKDLSAVVANIIEDEDSDIIIFDLDEFIADFYNIRKIALEIIVDQYEGAMVANSSIVKKEGIEGVYIVDVNGMPSFKPIKTKISNKEYSILHDGYFEKATKDDPGKPDQVKTINLYDEIVTKGNKVREGRRIR